MRFPGFEGEWEEKCFSDLADGFEYGMNSAACEFDGSNRYIRITDIDDNTHEYIDSCPVSPDGEMNEKYIVKEHDILFARTGASTGKTYLYNKKDGILYFAGFLIRANVNAFNDSYFVFNLTLTQNYNNWVQLTSMRSGQPGINALEYATYKMFVPQIDEQHKIALFLKLLDKKIKLQRQLLESLKLYKRGLLSKLFPRNGESMPQYRFKGFTDAWKQCKLTDFVKFFAGLTYTPSDVQDTGTLVLRSSNVKEGEIVDTDNVYVNSSIANSENVKEGDIIIVVRNGSRSLIGKHAQIKHFMPNTVIGAFMVGIRSQNPSFVNALLDTSHFEKEIAINIGATINQITGYMFSKMEFMIPDLEEQRKVGAYFKSLDHFIILHQNKLKTLEKIKNGLLQNLFI